MKVEHPNAPELTPTERQELAKLKQTIEAAIADGHFTREERDRIQAMMYQDGKVSVEELTLYRQLVNEHLAAGTLVIDWQSST